MTPTERARRSDALYYDTESTSRRCLCDMIANRESDLEELRAENATLRQQLADATESMGRVEKRCAKLREYVTKLETANLDVTARLTDYIGQYDPTDAFVAEVKAENAKLRELVRAAYNCTNAGPSCLECRIVAGGCTLLSAMRELGVVE